jgi:hypothetical protein
MPWSRLDDSLYDHPKVDALGRHRLQAVGLWVLIITWSSRHLTDGHVTFARIRQLGGSKAITELLVAAGLLDKVDDSYLVHDFLDYNDSRADIEARRSAEREKKRKQRLKGSLNVGRNERNGRYESLSPSRLDNDGDTLRDDPGDSSRESSANPTRPNPSRESLKRESRESRETSERTDVQALLDRGWKRVTPGQRRVLDEILDRHDVTGPEFAAEVIRTTPPGHDPLAAVMEADRRWQADQRAEADDEERNWQATKAGDRKGSWESIGSILGRLREPGPAGKA